MNRADNMIEKGRTGGREEGREGGSEREREREREREMERGITLEGTSIQSEVFAHRLITSARGGQQRSSRNAPPREASDRGQPANPHPRLPELSATPLTTRS